MHELSIAQNIIELAQNHVPESDWAKIRTIRLRIGKASGIEPEALEFSFNAIIQETNLSQAHLEIEIIPFTFICNKCGKTTISDEYFAVCPRCGTANIKILSGLELNISEIELEEK